MTYLKMLSQNCQQWHGNHLKASEFHFNNEKKIPKIVNFRRLRKLTILGIFFSLLKWNSDAFRCFPYHCWQFWDNILRYNSVWGVTYFWHSKACSLGNLCFFGIFSLYNRYIHQPPYFTLHFEVLKKSPFFDFFLRQ